MRQPFSTVDFADLAGLWNRFYPPKYRVDPGLLRSHTVESDVFDWGASVVETQGGHVEGFVIVKRSACPRLYRGPDPDVAHLAAIAFERPEVGVDLVASVKSILRDRGMYRLVFGQDSRHFFPGCPCDFPVLWDFLTIEGFTDEGPDQHDLERDLRDYDPGDALHPLGSLATVQDDLTQHVPISQRSGGRPVACPVHRADLPLLEAFLAQEFPGRWHYDVMDKARLEGSEGVIGLFENGNCIGFALTQTWTDQVPIGGAVWRSDLGDRWGSLGPIGVAKTARGRGLGDALLGAGLLSLKLRGARRTIIDWTTLVDFYARHGFSVERTYRTRALRLDDGSR